jgi:hypothetical protein
MAWLLLTLGARLRGLDSGGVAEIVQVARFGAHALNLVFRVNGREMRFRPS